MQKKGMLMFGAGHVIVTTLHTCPCLLSILCRQIEGEKRKSTKAYLLLKVWSFVQGCKNDINANMHS
jgi:hypothetical protein